VAAWKNMKMSMRKFHFDQFARPKGFVTVYLRSLAQEKGVTNNALVHSTNTILSLKKKANTTQSVCASIYIISYFGPGKMVNHSFFLTFKDLNTALSRSSLENENTQ
jgi:hypothetical protein